MIRIETENAWLLLEHAEHAALAGEFAGHWKNEQFAPPEPFSHVLDAYARHDDSWRTRDAVPVLTPEGNPSAFSSELVGTYDAFEEIDLEDFSRLAIVFRFVLGSIFRRRAPSATASPRARATRSRSRFTHWGTTATDSPPTLWTSPKLPFTCPIAGLRNPRRSVWPVFKRPMQPHPLRSSVSRWS